MSGAWTFHAEPDLVVVGFRELEEEVLAQLEIELSGPTLQLRIAKYKHTVAHGQASPPPLEKIEAYANEPRNLLSLLDMRNNSTRLRMSMPKILEDARKRGKKPDRFYARVLVYKRACEEYGQPYAETIARDNHVEAGVVYRWVAEAKRRQITIDDDDEGQIRIKGEPMEGGL